ncbi:MAG: cell division protein FtsK [OM182 bacterium MED-G24]|uniref:DNA translocase FtsK n=1 Tax=OM182 bacterium MED-G24 TaxID=1986255 RepID=A0A2A5WTN1_9GAMM|nr:MAG: cell division protein FtsK [OM182 bacterium MED-G24]
MILLAALCAYLFLALVSFDPSDPGWTYSGHGTHVNNLVGQSGAWLSDVLFFVFGFTAFIFPLMLTIQCVRLFREQQPPAFDWVLIGSRALGLVLTIGAGAGLASLHFYVVGTSFREGSGGVLGGYLVAVMEPAFSDVGATLILLAVFLIGLTALTHLSWLQVMDSTGRLTFELVSWSQQKWHRLWQWWLARRQTQQVTESRQRLLAERVEVVADRPEVVIEAPVEKVEPVVVPRVEKERQGNLFKVTSVDGLPPFHILDPAEDNSDSGYSREDLEAMSMQLELKLKDYGVTAEVVAVLPGPVITRFEIQPAAGVKVSRISGLVKDLARSLAVTSVRVVEVIPGKSVVGVEIPNVDRETVRLSEVLTSKVYDNSHSPLSMALGHSISGEPIVVDLQKMPHLLVAGTTGSGKSVGLNAMLLSILFKSSPEDVRLIMVDPKMLELAIYEGIPHLLTPVVTDMKDAANALRWCVAEMERRYRLMAALGVRNLGGFNRKVKDAEKAGEPIPDPLWNTELMGDDVPVPGLETLPYIVVVIDEFADMMMIVGKKVEQLIARIAQKARAAGIHLILATQRPSVDVITGLIKANVPTRIAFQVSSKVDSRTILDQGGAEQLLGQGDMLYLPSGSPIPVRVHGAFVEDDEVHRVVECWKELGEPNYLESILDSRTDAELLPGVAGATGEDDDSESDPLYDEAVQFVTESRRASISAVQRKLRIGYNRAARMIETMEAAGVVSGMNSNGSREVLANEPPE